MAPRRIVVLVNAQARLATRNPGLPDRLRRLVGRTGSVLVTSHAEEVPAALAGAGPLDDAVVAICGGDGTGMFALSALRTLAGGRDLPPVALLPAGTVNTIAKSLGMRDRPEQLLGALVDRVARGAPPRSRTHATLVANERVGFIFGAGLVSNFFALYNDSAAAGRLWAAAQVGRIFVGSFVGSRFAARIIAPTPVRLVVDGVPCPLERVSLLLASTLVDVGLGLKVTYRADEALDAFHIVGTDLPPSHLGPQLPRVLTGRRLRAEPLLDTLAREVLLELPEGSKTLLDGELFPGGSVRLQAGPRVTFVW